MKTLLVALLIIAVSGCANYSERRPWDPKPNQSLFEQMPPWDNAAEKTCCSHLDRAEYLKAKCDTSRPTPPRTNRC